MTYPQSEVRDFLGQHFELIRVSLADRDEQARALIRSYRMLWSPGFVVLDDNGTEHRRFLGFQHARDLIAELNVALGKVYLLQRRFAEAFTAFREVGDLDPPAPVSAEGLYWSGIARFNLEKQPVDWLREYWAELGQRFPESRWWTHADVWEQGAGSRE